MYQYTILGKKDKAKLKGLALPMAKPAAKLPMMKPAMDKAITDPTAPGDAVVALSKALKARPNV